MRECVLSSAHVPALSVEITCSDQIVSVVENSTEIYHPILLRMGNFHANIGRRKESSEGSYLVILLLVTGDRPQCRPLPAVTHLYLNCHILDKQTPPPIFQVPFCAQPNRSRPEGDTGTSPTQLAHRCRSRHSSMRGIHRETFLRLPAF